MPLATELGLGAHATMCQMGTQPPPQKGAQTSIFGPCLLQPKWWMNPEAVWFIRTPC